MHSKRFSLVSAAALAVALAAPALAQETPAPPPPATETPPPAAAPPPVAPPAVTPPVEAPAPEAVAPATPPAVTPPAVTPEVAAPAAPPEPEVTVTQHGAWEIGCLAGTPQCEMQQVAVDPTGNPVILVRIVRLPEGAEAPALVVFNTPLGTLLPTGLGFQVDASPPATLPFQWCVQEGCVVRLGIREPELAAMKRGAQVNLKVTSIADASAPVDLTLSLSGFTAGYDSLPLPPAEAPPPQ